MKRDQYVIACIEDEAGAATVMPWARHMAGHLRHKGLMALHVNPTTADAPEWLRRLGVPYASLRGDWQTAIEGLPTAFGGILAVAAVAPDAPRHSLAHPATLLRNFQSCKTAYLCVHDAQVWDDSPEAARPRVVLSMTHRREGKEKLVWASYLARFLNADIAIAHPDYRDADLRRRWMDNMRFADKVLSPFDIRYSTPVVDRDTRVDETVLDRLTPDLLIARTTDTRERDLFDLFATRPERRLLAHPTHTPLLFLNPRDDLYILCD